MSARKPAPTVEAVSCVRVHVRAPHALVVEVMKWTTEEGISGLRGGGSGPCDSGPSGFWYWIASFEPVDAARVLGWLGERGVTASPR